MEINWLLYENKTYHQQPDNEWKKSFNEKKDQTLTSPKMWEYYFEYILLLNIFSDNL